MELGPLEDRHPTPPACAVPLIFPRPKLSLATNRFLILPSGRTICSTWNIPGSIPKDIGHSDGKYPPGSILDRLNGQLPCYITYTTDATAQIIRANLHKSPMYSGVIEGVGPRYCPSIEDKIVKFPEKERQQIFLEPEGIATDEIYVNGFSTCLPLRSPG